MHVVGSMFYGLCRIQSLNGHIDVQDFSRTVHNCLDSSAPFGISAGGNWQIVFNIQFVVELHDICMSATRSFATLVLTLCRWRMIRRVHDGLSVMIGNSNICSSGKNEARSAKLYEISRTKEGDH